MKYHVWDYKCQAHKAFVPAGSGEVKYGVPCSEMEACMWISHTNSKYADWGIYWLEGPQ